MAIQCMANLLISEKNVIQVNRTTTPNWVAKHNFVIENVIFRFNYYVKTDLLDFYRTKNYFPVILRFD